MTVSNEVRAVAGKKFYIGTAMTPADNLTNSSFTSMTWTQVNGWETCGKLGDTRSEINVSLIDTARDTTALGTKQGGKFTNNFARLVSDAGQAALEAARAAGVNYAFKVEGNEAGATTVSQRLFVGVVTDASLTGGSANTIDMLAASIAINSNLVVVAAT